MIEIDDVIFQKNLLLTQTYCELQLRNPDNNPATALRTFNPVYNEQKLFSYTQGDGFMSVDWATDPYRDSSSLYDKLFEGQLEHKHKSLSTINLDTKFNGKILVAEIDMSVTDGASEVQSEGFIDVYDCPPIDTWFYKILEDNHRIFCAWVPQPFVELANNAIAVNCVDCLLWYDDWVLREKVTTIKAKKADPKISFVKYFNKLLGK